MYRYFIKRLLDIIFSLILIILLSPLMIIVSIISKCVTGKFIFKQYRDGLKKKKFMMYKFSSIKPNREYSKLLNVIRSFGLDELPQLFNILKGDMSFIGPRPFITGEPLPTYPDKKVYTVRPGVISLATAKGRRKISHEQRLEYDLIYANKVNFILDIKILFGSICVILKQNTKGDGEGQTK
jgi:lipopolysaccharide/colanic/teichoic acid biosynthesis glycosyltransferase